MLGNKKEIQSAKCEMFVLKNVKGSPMETKYDLKQLKYYALNRNQKQQ